jgi:hypothetical protein
MNLPSDVNEQNTHDEVDYEYDDEEEESLGIYGWDISKIKIGRI